VDDASPGSVSHRVALIAGRHLPRSYFVIHCYLKLTEVPLLLCDVPTLEVCLGEQRSSSREAKRTLRYFRAAEPKPEALHQVELSAGGGFRVYGLGFRVSGLGFRV